MNIQITLLVTATCRSPAVLAREEPHSLSNVNLSPKSGVKYTTHCAFSGPKYAVFHWVSTFIHLQVKYFPHWNCSKKSGRGDLFLKYADINTKQPETHTHKKQGNVTSPKEHGTNPVTDQKKWSWEVSDKELKIIILQMFSKIKDKTDNELRKTMH